MASCRDRPCDSASCRDSRQEAKSHGQSLQDDFPSTTVSAGSKRSRTVSAEAKYDGQFLQEARIGGLVYTQWPGSAPAGICPYRRHSSNRETNSES